MLSYISHLNLRNLHNVNNSLGSSLLSSITINYFPLTGLTNLRGTAYSLTSVTISWDHVVATSFNCAEEEHLNYMVSLLYPNGTDLQISTTLNHINFKNLTKGTTYVITVTAATNITGAASSSQITVTTGTKLEKGSAHIILCFFYRTIQNF